MKHIVVASKNPTKIISTENAFKRMFPDDDYSIQGVSVESGVQDQPMSDEETYQGALNRVDAVSKIADADYYVGIEGGIEEKNGEMEVFAWIIIRSKEGVYGKGRTATFFLPSNVTKLIQEGKELGDATDEIFQENNSKEKGGTIGLLTDGILDRIEYYTETVVIALIPFKHPEFYSK